MLSLSRFDFELDPSGSLSDVPQGRIFKTASGPARQLLSHWNQRQLSIQGAPENVTNTSLGS